MFEDIILWILMIVVLFLAIVLVLPGFALIRDNQVGIVTRKMLGEGLPEGHIIATKGEVGVQSETLMPGLYWRFPIFWTIEHAPITTVSPGTVGIVESIDGQPLPAGRLLGDEVDCDSYQNATKFLNNGGRKGLQVGILRPGQYRINTKVFHIKSDKATVVQKEMIGVVVSLDGIPLGSTRVVAPAPNGDHGHFQNGQAFINNNGYRGPQLETLQPGEYYINSFLFEVTNTEVATVPPGYVAVVISSVGEDIEISEAAPNTSTEPNLNQSIVTSREVPLITDKNQRGILRDPVAPGKYNLNRIAYKVELVPTSAVTIKWGTLEPEGDTLVSGVDRALASQKASEFYQYSQLRSTSKDGFQLDVDVKLIIRIPPENAPYVISRFGTVHNLIEQVVHPLIDSSFRNEAGERSAMDFIHSRVALQGSALKKAQEEFSKYHVEVQGLLIAYIKVDQALLDTQTKKQIAVQQQEQYQQEARAQEERIAVAEKTARADKQTDVIAAKLSIDIATDKAQALRKEAEGIRDKTKTEADGTAYEAQKVGEAQAAAYKAQTDVLGQNKVAVIKLMEKIADAGVVITPRVNVSGGGTGAGMTGNVMETFLAMLISEDEKMLGKSLPEPADAVKKPKPQ